VASATFIVSCLFLLIFLAVLAALQVNSDINGGQTKAKTVPSTKRAGDAFVGPNPCAGMDLQFEPEACVVNSVVKALEQAGANVTKGYQGQLNTAAVPITTPFCNVHWHRGVEHFSLGSMTRLELVPRRSV
jgi:hypothetical protein